MANPIDLLATGDNKVAVGEALAFEQARRVLERKDLDQLPPEAKRSVEELRRLSKKHFEKHQERERDLRRMRWQRWADMAGEAVVGLVAVAGSRAGAPTRLRNPRLQAGLGVVAMGYELYSSARQKGEEARAHAVWNMRQHAIANRTAVVLEGLQPHLGPRVPPDTKS